MRGENQINQSKDGWKMERQYYTYCTIEFDNKSHGSEPHNIRLLYVREENGWNPRPLPVFCTNKQPVHRTDGWLIRTGRISSSFRVITHCLIDTGSLTVQPSSVSVRCAGYRYFLDSAKIQRIIFITALIAVERGSRATSPRSNPFASRGHRTSKGIDDH